MARVRELFNFQQLSGAIHMDRKMAAAVVALVLGGVLLVGIAIGSSDGGSDQTLPAADDGRILSNGDERIYFPVNESGETYGRGDLPVVPDLVLAIGDDGTEGYIRDSDLFGTSIEVPLYDSDGRTVIGTFTLKASGPSDFGQAHARLVSERGDYFAGQLGVSEILFTSSDPETGWVIVYTSDTVEELGARSLQSIDGIVIRVQGGAGPLELQSNA